MPRLVKFEIDTALNSLVILDYQSDNGNVFLDFNAKIGQPITISRNSDLSLSDVNCQIRITTPIGSTGFFSVAQINQVVVDGVALPCNNFASLITTIGLYLFTSVGGGACADATVTDGDGSNHSVPSGGSYTCIPINNNITWTAGVGNQDIIYRIMGFDGSVTAQSLTNVSSYLFYKNDVLTTVPFSFTNGDRIWMQITRSNTALAASVGWNTTGITNPVSISSTTYYKPRTTIFTENSTLVHDVLDGARVNGTGSTSGYLTNAIFSNPVKGAFELIWEPALFNQGSLQFGLNNQSGTNTPPNRFPRMRYSIMFSTNSVLLYESGNPGAVITVQYNYNFHWRIKSTLTSPGVYTITYSYSTNNKSTWTLLYTSTLTHNGTVNFYADWIVERGYFIKFQLPQITQQ